MWSPTTPPPLLLLVLVLLLLLPLLPFQSKGTSSGKYHMLSAFEEGATLMIRLPRGIMEA